jgi:hypothetical protein
MDVFFLSCRFRPLVAQATGTALPNAIPHAPHTVVLPPAVRLARSVTTIGGPPSRPPVTASASPGAMGQPARLPPIFFVWRLFPSLSFPSLVVVSLQPSSQCKGSICLSSIDARTRCAILCVPPACPHPPHAKPSPALLSNCTRFAPPAALYPDKATAQIEGHPSRFSVSFCRPKHRISPPPPLCPAPYIASERPSIRTTGAPRSATRGPLLICT